VAQPQTAAASAAPAPPAARATDPSASAALASRAPAFFAGPPDGKLHVYFLDVHQGDATLLVSPTGETMLIDGGPEREASHLVHRLPQLLRGPLDWVVLTDPAPEHLGGLIQVLQSFGGGQFLDPGLPSPSAGYQALLAEVTARGLTRVSPLPDPAAPGAPVRDELGGGVSVEVFWPRAPVEQPLLAGDAFPDANALVLRVRFGKTSLLLASDMLAATEQYLLHKRLPFRSTLLKVSDHGSDRASTEAFLEAVSPRAVVVTTGPGPREGLPSAETIARLESVDAQLFRSDLDGEIHAVSDGTAFTLTAERAMAGEAPGTPRVFRALRDGASSKRAGTGAQPRSAAQVGPPSATSAASAREARYVASRHGKVFHVPDCRNAKRIKPSNLITFKSREEALKRYRPAKDCHP
jgi:beta-lactamase superfamily II metal-dependent hydrolase